MTESITYFAALRISERLTSTFLHALVDGNCSLSIRIDVAGIPAGRVEGGRATKASPFGMPFAHYLARANCLIIKATFVLNFNKLR